MKKASADKIIPATVLCKLATIAKLRKKKEKNKKEASEKGASKW
jgi:hypothetical protein